ncbi:MAG: homocysteine S-methyltransferase family protein [Phycisphaerae bacterium]|nr:homocysteine S-methyltransferase family protein [Phycisphaerae bacterium]
MGRMKLGERIRDRVFLLDGAMGTQLINRKIEVSKCNDYLNIERPSEIELIHRDYIRAGSDAVLTNTFGANCYTLSRHGLEDQVELINKAGAQIARSAAGEDNYVLGDIGPTGDFLAPFGNLDPVDLQKAFTEQAKGLLAGGVDGFIIETMSAMDEITIAVEAVKNICNLPIFASLSFDRAVTTFRTMMGVDIDSAVSQLILLGAYVVGFNCGKMSLDDYVLLAKDYVSAAKRLRGDIIILAEPNAGMPDLVDDQAVYNIGPDEFAETVEKIHNVGVNIVGGCCGTEPAHIRAAAERLKKKN